MNVTQTEFQAALLDPNLAAPQGLRDQDGVHTERRFNVYRNNVAVSLNEALEAGFPVIAKLLGEANFKPIAGVYLRQSPPQSPLMMHYGQDFPDFLRSFEPLAHLGYLGDVAELELAMRRSYHAADAKAIAPEALTTVAPEDLPNLLITLAPSVILLHSPWPIFDIWRYNSFADQPKPTATPQDVVVMRAEFDPAPVALPAGGLAFLRALQKQLTLGEAAEAASQVDEAFDLSAILGLLLGHGAIAEIQLKETP